MLRRLLFIARTLVYQFALYLKLPYITACYFGHTYNRQPLSLDSLIWESFSTNLKTKKLSYRRGTARCVVSIEILPIATQQCRNYLYDKSWPNRWYEVGDWVGGNAWYTMCTQPWRHRVSSHCLRRHKQTDDVELCISPVYRRLALAKFSKSTMWKLLTWPWPRPLRELSLITRRRLCMADPCTKFEVSSISRCGEITRGVKF